MHCFLFGSIWGTTSKFTLFFKVMEDKKKVDFKEKLNICKSFLMRGT